VIWQKYGKIYNVKREADVKIKETVPLPTLLTSTYPIDMADVSACFPDLASRIENAGKRAAEEEEDRIRTAIDVIREIEIRHSEHKKTKKYQLNASAQPISPPSPTPRPLSIEEQADLDWKRDVNLRQEFANDFKIYLAYKRAKAAGLVKIYGR